MKNILLLYALLVPFCIAAASKDSTAPAATTTVIVIPVSGDVEPGMAAFIARAIRENRERPNPLFILEMDTFGGRVDAALQIADTLLHVNAGRTIAFVKNKAISAGALIALACNELAMKPNTTIGDCAPIALSEDGPKMLGEKFQSPLRAQFRTMAKRNNYPSTLAESMVTQGMIVYRLELADTVMYVDSVEMAEMSQVVKKKIISKKTIVGPNELLTMDDHEAREYGFSSMSVSTVEELLAAKGIRQYDLVRIEQSWSEVFVRYIATIAPILMMIGFAALYAETKTPGFGIFGVIGILCLGLVFAGQYLVGLASYTELLLILIGVLLLGVELFVVPGFGVFGIAGLAFIAAGMILSLQGFVVPKPEFPWQRTLLQRNVFTVLGSLAGSLVLILLFFRYLLEPISKVLPGPYLSATLSHPDASEAMPAGIAVGDTGIVTKTLRPSGIARFGTLTLDVVCGGEFVEEGSMVKVVEARGNRIVVEKVS